MTECNHRVFEYATIKGRKVQAGFTGGEVTSDGGAMLLRQVNRRLGEGSGGVTRNAESLDKVG